jgi:hypothetical protein
MRALRRRHFCLMLEARAVKPSPWLPPRTRGPDVSPSGPGIGGRGQSLAWWPAGGPVAPMCRPGGPGGSLAGQRPRRAGLVAPCRNLRRFRFALCQSVGNPNENGHLLRWPLCLPSSCR